MTGTQFDRRHDAELRVQACGIFLTLDMVSVTGLASLARHRSMFVDVSTTEDDGEPILTQLVAWLHSMAGERRGGTARPFHIASIIAQ